MGFKISRRINHVAFKLQKAMSPAPGGVLKIDSSPTGPPKFPAVLCLMTVYTSCNPPSHSFKDYRTLLAYFLHNVLANRGKAPHHADNWQQISRKQVITKIHIFLTISKRRQPKQTANY